MSRLCSAVRARRGSMFVELAVGVVIAMIAMIAVAQVVAVLARQRAELAQTQAATQAAANVMERVALLGWEEWNDEQLAAMELPEKARESLLDSRLRITLTNDAARPLVKQVAVRLDWRNRAGERVRPVEVFAWRHQEVSE